MIEDPILVMLGGPPRSGTTLFAALMDGHPAINWLPDEGYFFEHLHVLGPENFERFVRAGTMDLDGLVEGIRDRSLMPPTHLPPIDFPALRCAWSEERFRAVLAARAPATALDFWRLLRDAYLAALGYAPQRYLTMKAADYGRSVFGALDLMADARGIVVVREPVGAVNSLKAYRERRGVKLLAWPTLVQAVADMNRLAETVDRYGPDRLRVERYEDFAADPAAAMPAIADWLGIENHPALTAPSMLGHPWSNNSSFGVGESGVAPLPGARRTVLSEAERAYVLWATEPFRRRFGY